MPGPGRDCRRASSKLLLMETQTVYDVPSTQLLKIQPTEEMPHLNNIPGGLWSHKFILFQQVLNNWYLPTVKKNIPYKLLLESWEKRQTHTHVQVNDSQGAVNLGLYATIFSLDRGILQHQTCCQTSSPGTHSHRRHEADSLLISTIQTQKASIGTQIRLPWEIGGERGDIWSVLWTNRWT